LPFPSSIIEETSAFDVNPFRSRSLENSVAEGTTTFPPAEWQPTQPLDEKAAAASPSNAQVGELAMQNDNTEMEAVNTGRESES